MALLDGTVVNVALVRIGARPRREPGRPAVDHQRLPARARLAHPARRLARRPLRPAPRLRHRGRVVRRRLGGLRAGADTRSAHRRPGAPGRRRRAAHARQPGDDPGLVPARRPRQGDRHVVGARRHRRRPRPVRRRLARAVRELAVGVPRQPAARRRRRCGSPSCTCPRPATRTPTTRFDVAGAVLATLALGVTTYALIEHEALGAGCSRRGRRARARRRRRLRRGRARAARTRWCRRRSSPPGSSAPPTP